MVAPDVSSENSTVSDPGSYPANAVSFSRLAVELELDDPGGVVDVLDARERTGHLVGRGASNGTKRPRHRPARVGRVRRVAGVLPAQRRARVADADDVAAAALGDLHRDVAGVVSRLSRRPSSPMTCSPETSAPST